MSTVIVYTNPETRGVCLCTPTGLTSLEHVKARDCPQGRLITVPITALPAADADFFDAWEIGEFDRIEVSLDKAREITKQRLRRLRTPMLTQLDIAFQRALEEGKPTARIVAEKVRLRNITQAVLKCTTTAELRALSV